MLKFKSLGKDVKVIEKYIEKSSIEFCDISLGAKYLWRDEFKIDYAIVNDTLILKESCNDYKNAFYYPMGKDEKLALKEIDAYCLKKGEMPTFCCIDNHTSTLLSARYKKVNITNDRAWSDYIYDAESFRNFVGKKYSGQRNHINKFNKLYPDYSFQSIEKKDIDEVKKFIGDFEKESDFSMWTAKEEDRKIRDYIESMFSINQVGGLIRVGGKVVAISIGEIVKNTLIVHVEKALREYEGVYPKMANEFAKAFAIGEVVTINREEDCGDMGLRISKLQYHPIEIKEKNIVRVQEI